MAQEVRVGARGLWITPNDLLAPEGSLKTADNVILSNGTIEPSRGFSLLEATPTLTGPINAAVFFAGSLIVHHSTASVSRWTGSAWTPYAGTFTPRDPTNSPPRFREAEGSLFLVNVIGGIYELDEPITNAWRVTGSPQGLDSTATLNRTSGTSGWMTPDTASAYRYNLAYRNANDKLELGAPSGRFLVVNPTEKTAAIGGLVRAGTTVTVTITSHGYATGDIVDLSPGEANFAAGQKTITVTGANTFTYTAAGAAVASTATEIFSFAARNVTVRVNLPTGLTTSHFIQLYRSAMAASAADEPSDEVALVYEVAVTSADITAGYRDIVDVVPDNLRAASAYYAPSQGGIQSAKARPPECTDAVQFKGSLFCAATQELKNLQFTLLGVGGTAGMQSGDIFFIHNATADTSYPYLAGSAEIPDFQFQLFTSGTAAENIADTAKSLCRIISGHASAPVSCFYESGPNDPPGLLRLVQRTPSTDDLYVFTHLHPAKYWSPHLQTMYGVTNIARAGTTVTANISTVHDFRVGQSVYLDTTSSDFPSGFKTLTSVGAMSFTYTEAGAAVGGAVFYSVIEGASVLGVEGTKFPSDLEMPTGEKVHRLMWSNQEEPWAVPGLQGKNIGNLRSPILRVIELRDSLLVEKEDGTWRVTGDYPNWLITPLDPQLRVIAPEASVSIANGRAYSWTVQGIQDTVDASTLISEPINSVLSNLVTAAPNAVKRYAWGLSYEAERRYLLGVPTAEGQTSAQTIYIYDRESQGWTKGLDTPATCATVDPTTKKLYLGKADGSIWVERKALTTADYQWPTGAISTTVEWVPFTAGRAGAQKLWDRGSFDFGAANFTNMSLDFVTDLSPSFSDVVTVGPDAGPTSNPVEVSFGIPWGWQRGSRLGVRMKHTLNQEKFVFQGLTVNYRITSQQAGK